MSCIGRQIDQLRLQIPDFICKPGCHNCCGPITVSSGEMVHLSLESEIEHDAALAERDCIHPRPNGCEAYEGRPLICRLFGTTSNPSCPKGRGPEVPVTEQVERQVHALIASTRQVLV